MTLCHRIVVWVEEAANDRRMSSLASFDSQNSQPDNLEVSLSQSDPDDAPLPTVPPKDDRGLSDELSHINIGKYPH